MNAMPVRLPVDKAQAAVSFLRERGGGVMDLIAHFWERLAQTPPLQRADLHLVVAVKHNSNNKHTNTSKEVINIENLVGAMLYVPKAHRADVLALDSDAAAAFVRYIALAGQSPANPPASDIPVDKSAEIGPGASAATPAGKLAIDYLTGGSDGIEWMVPPLLLLVNRKTPARQLVNTVMQLPANAQVTLDNDVRLAREADIPVLHRWRKLYKEERGIPFDADVDAWVQSQKVFVCQLGDQVVAVAKLDLELNHLIEIGGVFTFPEHRKHGYGARIVSDLAARIRHLGKIPTLQVDRENKAALHLYQRAGWNSIGSLARVWLTG